VHEREREREREREKRERGRSTDKTHSVVGDVIGEGCVSCAKG
jgi:hypothetical protein